MIQPTVPPACIVSSKVASVRSLSGFAVDSMTKASSWSGRSPAARAWAAASPPPAARSISRPSPMGSRAPEAVGESP